MNHSLHCFFHIVSFHEQRMFSLSTDNLPLKVDGPLEIDMSRFQFQVIRLGSRVLGHDSRLGRGIILSLVICKSGFEDAPLVASSRCRY